MEFDNLEQLLGSTADLGGAGISPAQLADLLATGGASIGGGPVSMGRLTGSPTLEAMLNNEGPLSAYEKKLLAIGNPSAVSNAPASPKNFDQVRQMLEYFLKPSDPSTYYAPEVRGPDGQIVQPTTVIPGSPRLAPSAQGEVVKNILESAGIGDNDITKAFNRSYASAIGTAAANAKNTTPLGVDTASKLYRYNQETKRLEVAPPNISSDEAQKQGFRIVPPKLLEHAQELGGLKPALAGLQAATEGANARSPAALGLSKVTGGIGGNALGYGQEGALLDTAQRDFAFQFDKLLGGVRAAASPEFFKAMLNRLPRIMQTPELRTKSLQLLETVVTGLEDEGYRATFGLPVNEENIKKAREAATAINKLSSDKSSATQAQLPEGATFLGTDKKTGRRAYKLNGKTFLE